MFLDFFLSFLKEGFNLFIISCFHYSYSFWKALPDVIEEVKQANWTVWVDRIRDPANRSYVVAVAMCFDLVVVFAGYQFLRLCSWHYWISAINESLFLDLGYFWTSSFQGYLWVDFLLSLGHFLYFLQMCLILPFVVERGLKMVSFFMLLSSFFLLTPWRNLD